MKKWIKQLKQKLLLIYFNKKYKELIKRGFKILYQYFCIIDEVEYFPNESEKEYAKRILSKAIAGYDEQLKEMEKTISGKRELLKRLEEE